MERVLWSLGQDLKLNIVKSKNCTLIDSEGREYIDLEAGIWSSSIGHGKSEVLEIIKEQADKVIHTGYCYADPIINEASETILDILGFKNGKCGFLCAGSESVVLGVRILQALLNDKLLLTFSNGFFGSYGDARDKNENSWIHFDWIKSCSGCAKECGSCDSFKSIPFDKIGEFVFEPGSSDFIKFPTKQLVESIVSKIRSNDGFVLSNEVTTGLGRTGKWFGFNHYNVKPDIATFGKSLGNGYPVSAVAINEKVAGLLSEEEFYYCQSHGNDALGASVAKKVIEIIKRDNLVEESNKKGSYLLSKLNEIGKSSEFIKEIRGRGLMISIEFHNSQNDIAHEVSNELFKIGFIVSNFVGMGHIRIDPAYTIESTHIEGFLEAFRTIMNIFQNK